VRVGQAARCDTRVAVAHVFSTAFSSEVVGTGSRDENASKQRSFGWSYCVIIFCRLYVAGLAPQQGHRGRIPMSALINRTRTVAIEFGMWRSGRKGGSSGSITFG